MRIIALFIIFFGAQACYGQSSIEKCGQTFRHGLDSATDSGWQIRLSNLRECLVGNQFPEFKATTLDGKLVTNADLKNKVVLVNLWFIGCAPCIKELPMLIELTEKYKHTDFVLLSFSTDNKTNLEPFIEKKKINYLVVDDAKELIENGLMMQFGYPTNIVINKTGAIIEFKVGAELDDLGIARTKNEFIKIIDKALNE